MVDCGHLRLILFMAENYGDLETSFRFQFTGNVYVIDCLDDLLALPIHSVLDGHFRFVDFEQCLADDIDAIHLTSNGEMATRFSKPTNLYGWDCESVLIMNPSGIVEVNHVPGRLATIHK